jgi:hypothetical protein
MLEPVGSLEIASAVNIQRFASEIFYFQNITEFRKAAISRRPSPSKY